MNKTTKEYIIDNIKLIYEFNPSSPLFARVASSTLEQGKILEALEILEKGIAKYPNYPSSYFIIGLAFAYMGKEKKAKDSAAKGAELLGYPETLEFYLEKIEEIITERNSLNESMRPDFVESNVAEQGFLTSLEDRLDILAEKLSKAKIDYNPDAPTEAEQAIPEYTGERIASDTLAGIYSSQKNYREAIDVYKELIRKHPDKATLYAAKIAEIAAEEEGQLNYPSEL